MPNDAASESRLACWAALSQDGVNVLLAGTGDALMWGNLYAGLYLEALGDHDQARELFEAAARADSHNNIAELARTHLRSVRRRAADAEWAAVQQELR